MSFFDQLTQFPADPILGLPIAFAADSRLNKVNLGIGSYRDAEGAPFFLPSVKEAEKIVLGRERNMDYLPIDGNPAFIKGTKELIFGSQILSTAPERIITVQTVGGTSALRLGGEFLSREISNKIFLPDPTWPNHHMIFPYSGMDVQSYRYYNKTTFRLDFSEMCSDILAMPPGSTILLHACCHNPTGIDPSQQEWQKLSELIKKQKLIPFFDFAYQGFKESIDDDAYPIRYFASQGHEMAVASSFSKTFGLYGERVGSFSVVTHNEETARKVGSQLKHLIRANYSNPPRHGAAIIAEILSSEELKHEWLEDLSNMRYRLKEMRHTLIAGLQAKSEHRDWSFLSQQHGFFSFCGLDEGEVHRLITEYAIYMPLNGRLNVAGVNGHNIDYVIEGILDVSHS